MLSLLILMEAVMLQVASLAIKGNTETAITTVESTTPSSLKTTGLLKTVTTTSSPDHTSIVNSIIPPISPDTTLTTPWENSKPTKLEFKDGASANTPATAQTLNFKSLEAAFFYDERELKVTCPEDPDVTLQTSFLPTVKNQLPDDHPFRFVDVRTRQRILREIGGLYTESRGRCESKWQAYQCVFIYGCYCTTTLIASGSKPLPPSTSIEDVQGAIEEIPGSVLAMNPGWSWTVPVELTGGETLVLRPSRGYAVEAGTPVLDGDPGPSRREGIQIPQIQAPEEVEQEEQGGRNVANPGEPPYVLYGPVGQIDPMYGYGELPDYYRFGAPRGGGSGPL
ncbi:hypothetical protein TWF718_001198 [Orbilia javanica]|uniref:Uncharacterized protein n=1 Tax=Orbilia javanica TaxID=47235 RepID=A0AAN8MY97_9PEZI